MAKRNADDPVVIKKYANRRLYDTSTSSYVTLEHLARLIRDGQDFVVQDAKTGEDLTRSVLAQIIFEEENKGTSLLPVNFLRQVIRFYGDQVQSVLPAYLDMSMNTFASQQEKWRESMKAFGGLAPMNAFEDMARRNMAMFEQAFGMFMPRTRTPERQDPEPPPAAPTTDEVDAGANALDALQAQIKAMQAQIDRLARSNGKS